MLCRAAQDYWESQRWAVCVIWGGHRVFYHSCSLCAMTFYEEFALRHVRAKWRQADLVSLVNAQNFLLL
jgi:hypothetical protein